MIIIKIIILLIKQKKRKKKQMFEIDFNNVEKFRNILKDYLEPLISKKDVIAEFTADGKILLSVKKEKQNELKENIGNYFSIIKDDIIYEDKDTISQYGPEYVYYQYLALYDALIMNDEPLLGLAFCFRRFKLW